MANVTEQSNWELGIYQIETSDAVIGGVGGIANRQALQLANRTLWLKNQVAGLGTGKQDADSTLAALANLTTSANQMIYATGADQFALTPLTAFIRTLLDDADAATARTTIGAAPLVSPALTGTPTAPTATDGTNTMQLATTAFVQSAVGGYISMTSTGGTITLTEEQASNPMIGFGGALTSDLIVVVPNTVRRLWGIANWTTGNFKLIVKTATGLGVPVAQGKRNLVYSNGTTVYDAFNDFDNIVLSGVSTAPTAVDGTNTTQVATTAFVQSAVGGYLAKGGLTGGTITLTDLEASNPVIGFSGALTSNLTVVLPTTAKRLWAIYNATTGAFSLTVKIASGTGVTVAQGKRNLVYTDGTNVYDGFNDFESISMTGAPTAPTAAAGTNTTQIATTAFVNAEIVADRPFEATTANIKMDGAQSVGVLNTVARGDHVHPTDTSRAPLASPSFTGTPAAPTPATGTRTTQLATTAFVGAESQIATPTGSVYTFAGATVPTGWLKCNGALLSRTTYAALFAVIGTTYGAGDGSTTFALPDLRGEFVRGFDDARGVDSGRALGSKQGDAIRNLSGEVRFQTVDGSDQLIWLSSGVFSHGADAVLGGHNQIASVASGSWEQVLSFSADKVVPTAAENRPRNVAMHYIIKF